MAGSPFSPLGLATNYVDSNVQERQTYYYVTTAVDDTGAESAYSNQASSVGNGQLGGDSVQGGKPDGTVPSRSPFASL